jgi:hypothetical protein
MPPPAAAALLAMFESAAAAAGRAEAALRERVEAEVAAAERARAFAYRRLNLMRMLARAIAGAESEEAAVGRGLAGVRAELGWDSDSDTRAETLSRLATVVRAAFASLAPPHDAEARAIDVPQALADFEAWYERAYDRSFWALFEQEIAEMPLVER